MREAVARAVSYVAFLGLFTYLYGRGDVARHGRRGFTVFAWEVAGFVLFDVVRVKLGWPAVTFTPVIGVVAVIKLVLIVLAYRGLPDERSAVRNR
jgi:hypothetical protein